MEKSIYKVTARYSKEGLTFVYVVADGIADAEVQVKENPTDDHYGELQEISAVEKSHGVRFLFLEAE